MCSFNNKEWCRQVILDHYQNPRNKGAIDNNKYISMHMNNPSCGDIIRLQVLLKNNIIKDILFEGEGCSICCASASMFTENIKNKDIIQVIEIINNFENMLNKKEYDENILGDANCLTGVSKLPARIKCAFLVYETMNNIIKEVRYEY